MYLFFYDLSEFVEFDDVLKWYWVMVRYGDVFDELSFFGDCGVVSINDVIGIDLIF